jgi:hypothetical protein
MASPLGLSAAGALNCFPSRRVLCKTSPIGCVRFVRLQISVKAREWAAKTIDTLAKRFR